MLSAPPAAFARSTSSATARGRSLASFVSSSAHRILMLVLLGASALKLGTEALVFRHLRSAHHSVGKRLALLMKGEFSQLTTLRFLAGGLGGLVLPLVGLAWGASRTPSGALTAVTVVLPVLLLTGELAERYLFFAAAPASRMPGGIA